MAADLGVKGANRGDGAPGLGKVCGVDVGPRSGLPPKVERSAGVRPYLVVVRPFKRGVVRFKVVHLRRHVLMVSLPVGHKAV